MVQIDTPASMESFRTFVMVSTCSSFAPQSYADDIEVFPEREEDLAFVNSVWKGTLELPSGRPQGQEIKVTYSYSEDGIMTCTFMDAQTGNQTSVDLDEIRKSESQSTADIDQFKVE